jgi:hypothetical protein
MQCSNATPREIEGSNVLLDTDGSRRSAESSRPFLARNGEYGLVGGADTALPSIGKCAWKTQSKTSCLDSEIQAIIQLGEMLKLLLSYAC